VPPADNCSAGRIAASKTSPTCPWRYCGKISTRGRQELRKREYQIAWHHDDGSVAGSGSPPFKIIVSGRLSGKRCLPVSVPGWRVLVWAHVLPDQRA